MAERPEPPDVAVEDRAGRKWNTKLPLTIVTVAPALYVATRIYIRTGDIGLAIGSGIICPFVIYGVLGAWLDESSEFTQRSWARWCANRSDEWPLVCAVLGALVFVGFFTLLWFAGSAALRQ